MLRIHENAWDKLGHAGQPSNHRVLKRPKLVSQPWRTWDKTAVDFGPVAPVVDGVRAVGGGLDFAAQHE
jgi:hypothetical protein